MPRIGRPSLEPEEAERVRAEVRAMRALGMSFPKIAAAIGDITPTAISLWLKPEGPNGISEQQARKVAAARNLPEDFWRNKMPQGGVTKAATEDDRVRWVAQQLGMNQADLLKLWRESAAPRRPSAIGDEEMHGLPDHVWAAAMATVHLEHVSIEQALKAAVLAWAEEQATGGPLPEHWLKAIAKRVAGGKRESGSYPRIRLGPQKK